MTDQKTAGSILEQDSGANHEFRPHTLSQSAGLIERRCSESEMLQYVIETESARQDLERYAKELIRLVDQSAKATREAQLAAKSKSDFLAMMSHEIRTPLNGIIGMTGVLLSKALGPGERDCVETIRHAGEALLAIIDQILDFSKIEAGRMELEYTEFEIAKAIEESIQIVQCAAACKGILLVWHIDSAVPRTVRGDIVKLRQILLNLLSNAVKFTERGKVELKAELAGFAQGEFELRFSVTDEGIGISEEQRARLFRPFTQADLSTTRKFGGTGLGLAICKSLTELMGGTIGVKTRPGEGSSFWFTAKMLPACGGFETASGSVLHETDSHAAQSDCRILLVEDNPINQKVAVLMLKSLGYAADVASNGLEAMESLAARRYDLVLMDCLMPELDGFEATRRIRAQQGYGAEVPIIAMTANAFTEDRDACLAAGMSDYLAKPVREPELRQKLDFWLSGKGQPFGVRANTTAV